MRFASSIRRIVIGLPIVILSAAIALQSAVGQGMPPWQGQQASTAAQATAPATRGAQTQQTNRKGALFQGQEIRLPKLPFMRSNTATKQPTAAPQPAANRFAANAQNYPRNGGQPNGGAPMNSFAPQGYPVAQASASAQQNYAGQRNFAAQQSGAGRPMPRQFSAAPTATPIHAQHNPNQIAARPQMQPTREAALAQMNRSMMQNPYVGRPIDRPLADPTHSPQRETAQSVAASNRSMPAGAAERLLTQAHESAGSAATEADFTQIIETCRQALAGQSNQATKHYANSLASWAFNRRGQIKADAGREQEAIADFDAAVKTDPNRWRAIHNRGVLLAQSGEFERAFDDFNRTIELNPEFAKAYSNRAALFVVSSTLEPALEDYAHAIELDPTLAVAHRGFGRACHLAGRSDEAIGHYDEAVRLAPEDAYAVASRADVLTDLGRYDEAAADYERAIQLDPKSGDAYSGSAWLLATCPDSAVRNPELALERATAAVALSDGDRAASFDTLAAAQANAGDFGAALATIRQAVQLATDEERAVYQERLHLYQRAKPYRIAPAGQVMQASYETVSEDGQVE